MDSRGMTSEVQQYIERIVERRNRGGYLTVEECQSILEYAAEIQSDAVFGIGYYFFAEEYWNHRDAENTMRCLTECAKCFRPAEMPEFLARAYNMMGAVSDTLENKVAALNYYYTGLKYAEQYGLDYVMGMLASNIAAILVWMKQDGMAVQYYERGIGCFRRAEETLLRSRNLVSGMMHCGSCYIRLGRKEKAYRLLEQIEQQQRERPEDNYPVVGVNVFRGECLAAQGRREEAYECIDEILESMERAESLQGMHHSLTKLANLLLQFEDYERLGRLLGNADALGLEKRTSLSMEMFYYRSKYLIHEKRKEEYVKFAGQYFRAYEKYRINNRQVTARVMELQDQLRSIAQEQEKMRVSNKELKTLALYDSMTNLANRTLINEHISRKFEEAQSCGKIFGVEILDIDFFKSYNDSYGHLEGDSCINTVAAILHEMESDRVFCGRYGGDEFVVVYSDMTVSEIQETAQQIQNRVLEKRIPHRGAERENIVTISQGVFASIPTRENKEWDFMSMADTALYRAKGQGRNCCRIETSFRHSEGKE